MSQVLNFLAPWEFSPTLLAIYSSFVALYLRGLHIARKEGCRTRPWRDLAFFFGLSAIYLFLQSHLDYLAQHLFWMHRLQNSVLHHVGPILIAVSSPAKTLARGTPGWLRRWIVQPAIRNPIARTAYRAIQNPFAAPLLFVGLIGFWLLPAMQFDAMLSLGLYRLMNWGMAVDGLLFWWLILGPPSPLLGKKSGYGTKIAVLVAIMPPQIALGATIALHSTLLYPIFEICGLASSISPLTDQTIGGLIIWNDAMMSVAGILILIRRRLREDASAPAPA